MRNPGFMSPLQEKLEKLPLSTLERVNKPGGLEIRDLLDFLLHPRDYTVDLPYTVDASNLIKNEDLTIEAFWLGIKSIEDGHTAICVVADDNSFKEAPGSATPILQLQIMKISWAKKVFLMVPPDKKAIAEGMLSDIGQDKVRVFCQYETFRFSPDNTLNIGEDGSGLGTCGSGDVVPALIQGQLLDEFNREGGRNVLVIDASNFLGSVYPLLVGQHLLKKSPVTCEVTSRKDGDLLPILCEHAGFNQLVDTIRLSSRTAVDTYRHVGTNTLVFRTDLDFSTVQWKWIRVKKRIDNKLLIQYERSICDLTATFQTQFIETPRYFCYMSLAEYAALKSAPRT